MSPVPCVKNQAGHKALLGHTPGRTCPQVTFTRESRLILIIKDVSRILMEASNSYSSLIYPSVPVQVWPKLRRFVWVKKGHNRHTYALSCSRGKKAPPVSTRSSQELVCKYTRVSMSMCACLCVYVRVYACVCVSACAYINSPSSSPHCSWKWWKEKGGRKDPTRLALSWPFWRAFLWVS